MALYLRIALRFVSNRKSKLFGVLLWPLCIANSLQVQIDVSILHRCRRLLVTTDCAALLACSFIIRVQLRSARTS
jgi:hypothetical protein